MIRQLRWFRVISHNEFPLNLPLCQLVLVVILWRKRLLVSMNHFMSTADATVYPRPRDPVARTVGLVELVAAARVKVCQVFV